ncbi:MAG: LysM peptidoglycan-binding domain-containing protein [Neobacillus sp.]
MDSFQRYELRQINPQSEEYEIVLHLADHLSEFADELGTLPREKKDVMVLAKQIVRERYPHIKVTMVKVIIGGFAITSLPLMGGNEASAQATAPVPAATQASQDGSIYYHVVAGDTLWTVSRKFNTTVDNIKRANHLTSDLLQLNQRIMIPKAFHTVGTGDYLTVLAKKYNTSVAAIKEANGLTSDSTRLGQMLIIPLHIDGQTSQLAPSSSQQTETSTYTVVAGDTLSGIAKRFGTTVEAIRASNSLPSDFLRIGQTLTLPPNTTTNSTPDPTASVTNQVPTSYTVVAGDSLSVIARRYGTTVEALRSANNLTSDLLRIGQTLTIPAGTSAAQRGTATPGPTETQTQALIEKRTTFTYSVRTGDSLSVIAKNFGVTVDAIRSANNLSSDLLKVGQALTIPNGINAPAQTGANTITYTTHTVVYGDNIWDLSVRYGIPQSELLRANNLTATSRLSIGQKLRIPVHNIGVKSVVSERNGEYMEWSTEAQYVFPIGKTAKVTDFATGKSFYIKRTIGANHADCETVTINDTNIARSIWGGFSWTPRAVIVEIDGRKVAASMSFMPHERQYITNNGITGHFDVYFGNSTRHIDGRADASHQAQVERAAGLR